VLHIFVRGNSRDLPTYLVVLATLWPVTKPPGSVYSPVRVFNLQLGGHIQYWNGVGISSAPTLCSRPWHLLVLFTVIVWLTYKVHKVQSIKSPWLRCRGLASSHIPLILRITPPELAPFLATLQVGCRASSGRFPPPLLMRAVMSALIQLF